MLRQTQQALQQMFITISISIIIIDLITFEVNVIIVMFIATDVNAQLPIIVLKYFHCG